MRQSTLVVVQKPGRNRSRRFASLLFLNGHQHAHAKTESRDLALHSMKYEPWFLSREQSLNWAKLCSVQSRSTFIKIVAIDLLDGIGMFFRNADAVFNLQVC